MLAKINFKSIITCPKCGNQKEKTMMENSCLIYYECRECKAVLRPKKGDCCVFCSYGTISCPPVQRAGKCC